jgi:hypothetical protein
MKRQGFLTCLVAAGAVLALSTVSPVAAQTFYREEFDTADTLPLVGWDNTHIGTFDAAEEVTNSAGVVSAGGLLGDGFHWWYNATPLQEPILTVTEASVTTAAEITTPITPITDLAISWGVRVLNYQYPGFNDADSGIPTQMRPAVQMDNGNWYASAQVFLTPDVPAPDGEANEFDNYSLPFSYTAANWRNLTLNTLVAGQPQPQGATIGGTPAGNLSGNIIGVGWAMTFSQRTAIHLNFIEIGVPPIPGDTNNDGDVDMDDFNTIRGNFGMTGALRTDGDVSGPGSGGRPDGIVDLYDFGQWKDNFPFPGAGSGGVGSTSVPEPASILLLLMPLVLARRFRRSRFNHQYLVQRLK